MLTPPSSAQDNDNQIRQGWQLLHQGKVADAATLCTRLLDTGIEKPALLQLASQLALVAEQPHRAQQFAERALAIMPNAAMYIQQAQCQFALRQRTAAHASLIKARQLAPDDIQVQNITGVLLSKLEHIKDAWHAFARANELQPGNPELLYNLATSQRFLGRFDDARQSINQILTLAPNHGQAILLRADLATATATHNHIDAIERLLPGETGNERNLVSLHFALAKEKEDIGDNAGAYAALTVANRLRRQQFDYDVQRDDVTLMHKLRRNFHPAATPVSADSAPDQPIPIFVLGLPRTGSTLIERMLSCHHHICSAGELPDFATVLMGALRQRQGANAGPGELVAGCRRLDYRQLGREYLNSASQRTDGKHRYFIDKLPANFVYCGLIKQALPQAIIIHMTRAPMDACYAIFKTLFQQANPYAYELDELGQYYVAYRQLMQHWHKSMPDQILDLPYEGLVATPQAQLRRVLDFCKLDWDPACLDYRQAVSASTTASAVQVRQEIYHTSVGKWQRFADDLAPLAAQLRRAGIAPEHY